MMVGAVGSAPVMEASFGPPNKAVESKPFPGGSGADVSFLRPGLGDGADDDCPVLVPAGALFCAASAVKQLLSASTCMASAGEL